MLSLIFGILLLVVFGKILIFAVQCAWGLLRILFTVIFLPVILVGIFLSGFATIAIILVAAIGLLSFFFD